MRRIAENFKGHVHQLVLGPLFKLFEAILELMVPLLTANIIDIGVAAGDTQYIVSRGLLMLLLGALGVAAAMICQYYAAAAGGHFGSSLRKMTFSHVLTLAGGDVSVYGAGGLITRLTNDVNQLQTGVNMAIRLATRAPFLAVGSILMAMRINMTIGLVFLISTPLIVLALYAVMKRTLPSYKRIQAGQDTLSRISAENLMGVRVIRAFSRQKTEEENFDRAADDLTALTVRVGKISAALNPFTSVIANIAIIAIVWIGARFVFSDTLATGEVVALINYMNQTLLAIVVATNMIVLFTRALASARRIAEVLDREPAIVAPITEATFSENPQTPAIAFDHVHFSYHDGAKEVLTDISFSLPQGKTVGLIGGTGSGKSTIINLIMRYHDVGNGSVRAWDADVRTVSPRTLRLRIGLVPQTAVLFGGTIRKNLLMANPNASEEDMWRALEVAQGASFVREMKQGIDADTEEGGKNLSGGQRQRLTIARALVRKPRLLILDDSASALDYATDARLRRALTQEKTARPEMTVLMVSQRAASIMHAEKILVLDDGRLVGEGTHDTLLLQNEVYREICHSQGIGLDVPDDGISAKGVAQV